MFRALSRWGVGLLLGALGMSAQAGISNTQMAVVLTKTTPTTVQATAGAPSLLSTLLNQPRSGAVTSGINGASLLTDLLNGPGPRSPATVAVARAVPWNSIGKAVARGLPLIGTAIAINEILDAVRCREGFGGGPECDAGTDEITVTGDVYTACGTYTSSSAASAASQCAAAQAAAWSSSYDEWCYDWTWTFSLKSCDASNPVNCTFGRTYSKSERNSCTGGGSGAVSDTVIPVAVNTETNQQCPTITVNNQPFVPTKDIDGKCPTEIYTPHTEAQVEGKITQWGSKAAAADALRELLDRNIPVDHDAPGFTVESPPQVVRETTVAPDGATTVRDTDFPWTNLPDGYRWDVRTREQTYPPGVTPPPPGTIEGGTVTTGPGGTAAGDDPITCGLPGTPPCKIDETGTPTVDADDGVAKATGMLAPLLACVTSPSSCLPELPSLNWSMTLPSGCGPIPMPGYAKWGLPSLDICYVQPIFHDLMALVWSAVGLFMATKMVFREATGGG